MLLNIIISIFVVTLIWNYKEVISRFFTPGEEETS
jgi:hypothetical protein